MDKGGFEKRRGKKVTFSTKISFASKIKNLSVYLGKTVKIRSLQNSPLRASFLKRFGDHTQKE